MHKRVSRAVIHISWYALVSVIVTSALLISLIGLTSSKIDDLRPRILEWVQTTTGLPVEVGKLTIEWRGVIPQLKLSTIKVLDRNSHKTLTHFDQAMLSVDLYRSLIDWKVTIAHLELSGLNVELLHKKNGTISLLELTEQPTTNNDGLTQWLLEQPHLQVKNSNIIWHEKIEQPNPLSLTAVELQLKNKPLKNKHDLSGSARLDGGKGSVDFVIDVLGDPLSAEWNAKMLFSTEELDVVNLIPVDKLETLASILQKENIALNNARLNSTTQITLKNAQISDLKGHFSLKNSDSIYAVSSTFQLEKSNTNGWILVLPNISVAALERQWQAFVLKAKIPSDFSEESPEFEIELNQLRIEDLISVIPESRRKELNYFQPKGELVNLKIQYNQKNPSSPMVIKGEFVDLKLDPYKKIPGVKNLSGSFLSSGDIVTLNLTSHDLILQRQTHSGELEEPLHLQQLSGDLEWKNSEQGWLMIIPQITLLDPDLKFQLTGSIKKDLVSSPELDLRGTFFRGNVEPIVKMIPSNLLKPKITEWLDKAIVNGQLTGGHVIFRGALDQFPFEDKQGFFEVRLNVENGVLDYFKGWPRIEQITAEVVFTEKNMFITAPYSVIDDTPVKNTTVELPELKTEKPRLLINGNAKGQVKDGIKFINNSPLKASIGKQLKNIKITGPLNLDLHLEIPLSKGREIKVKGKVHLQKNALSLDTLGIKIKSLNGDFIFTKNRWFAKALKARLYESAITINLDVDRSKGSTRSDVRLTGLADRQYITNRMVQIGMKHEQLQVLKSISGTTTWQASLSLPTNIGSPDEDTGLVITSNLKGMNILAPSPLGKVKSDSLQLKISTTLSKKPNRQITFEYADVIKGNIKLSSVKATTTLKKVDLHFGAGKPMSFDKDNYLVQAGGKLSDLDISAWSNFINRYFGKAVSTKPTKDLLSFNLSIGQLLTADRTFKNNHILGISSINSWELQVENDTAHGMISVPYQLAEQAIKADFERLTLVSSKGKSNVASIDPNDLPEIFLSSQRFQYNELKLGSLQMHVKPVAMGASIEKIVLSSADVSVDIVGKWLFKNKQQSSKFRVQAKGESLGALLEQFGFGSSGIAEGKTDIDINAKWNSSPTEFQLAKLKGSLALKVENGRLVEVKNRVGKVFGLLNIQSLGRRLSLDFNDLFEEGFSFDEISGDFEIDRGNAYTNNLNMLGPSANIDIVGRVGLVEQDYDQVITVTPAVSDSLPVASVLFGPVGAGVGAALLIAEKIVPIIPETIDKVLASQYTLKGSWKESLVEPLTQPRKEAGARGFSTN